MPGVRRVTPGDLRPESVEKKDHWPIDSHGELALALAGNVDLLLRRPVESQVQLRAAVKQIELASLWVGRRGSRHGATNLEQHQTTSADSRQETLTFIA